MKILKKIEPFLSRIEIHHIILLALLLRLIGLDQSLWHDEAIGALAVKKYDLQDLLSGFLVVDNHPPLYYLLLKIQTLLFGYSEVSLRFPSVIFGVANVYVVYKLAEEMFGSKRMSLLASFFLATSQLHVYYSQEARMYILSALLVSCLFYFYFKIRNEKTLVSANLIIFCLLVVLNSMTDYIPMVILIVFAFDVLTSKSRSGMVKKGILAAIPLLVFALFWSPYFFRQSEGGKWLLQTVPDWKFLAGGATVKQLALIWTKFTGGRISFMNKNLYFAYLALTSFVYLLLLAKMNFKKIFINAKLILYWLVLPVVATFVISFWVPALNYFRVLFVLPSFCILISYAIINLPTGTQRNMSVILIAVINIFSLAYYYNNPSAQREQWRQATEFVESNIKGSEIVLFSYPEPFSGYRWYEKYPHLSYGATNSIASDIEKTQHITESLIGDRQGLYYFEYLSDLSDPEATVRKTIENGGYKIENIYTQFSGIGKIYYFTRS